MVDLKSIELIREKMGIGYKEAKEALEEAGFDVVQALINLEEKQKKTGEKFLVCRLGAVEQIKKIWQKGFEIRFLLKQEDRTVVQVPAAVGVAIILGVMTRSELTLLATLGAVYALAGHYTVEVVAPEGKSIQPAG